MITRFDKLAIELPAAAHPSPNSAAAVQELLGGKFGEMSTLMNYTFQSFNFRGRNQMRPFYDLIANIAAEEFGHVELVAYTINTLLNGSTTRGSDPSDTPLEVSTDARNSYHFIASGQTALPVDSMGNPWTGQYVFSSGNLKLDLLHNFFLECGARANKIRVYEMVDDPVAREMCGYLLVQGSYRTDHFALAYATLLISDPLTAVLIGVSLLGESLPTGALPLTVIVVSALATVGGTITLARSSVARQRRTRLRAAPSVVSDGPQPSPRPEDAGRRKERPGKSGDVPTRTTTVSCPATGRPA